MTEQQRQFFKKGGFSDNQIDEIAAGMEKKLPVSIYAIKTLRPQQMYQIRLGLEGGFDMHSYATGEYDWFQLEEIRLGLENDVDVSKYDDANISSRKMRQIRKGLENKMDLTEYLEYDAEVIRQIRRSKLYHLDILSFVSQGYDADQLEQIVDALKDGLDIYQYVNIDFPGASIREMAEGLRQNADVELYARNIYSWTQMREIRLGMIAQLDISFYMSHLYDRYQMEQIRLGLEEGLEVQEYALHKYTANEMERQRLEMLELVNNGGYDKEEIVEDLPEGEENIAISISTDDMLAFIKVNPAFAARLTRKDIYRSLRHKDVEHNINAKIVDELLAGKHIGEKVIIAQGRQPENGADGWYEFFFDSDKNKGPKILPDGSVDYQNADKYEEVKAGQKLAYYHAASKGIEGRSVTNKRKPAVKGKDLLKLKGKGFILASDKKTYISTLTGSVTVKDNYMEVSPVVMLQDVNPVTGNVRFEGNVQIAGDVSGGVLVESDGDVTIEGFVEDSTIKAKGNVIIKKGINGGGVGYIEAGGDVTGKFFESVTIIAGGEVKGNYALNSTIESNDTVTIAGAKGVILGGSVFASKLVLAANVGNDLEVPTEIKLGISDKIRAKLRRLDGELAERKTKLDVLTKSQDDFRNKYSEDERNAMDIYIKIKNAIYTLELERGKLSEAKQSIMDMIAKNTDPKLVVTGDLFDNVSIEIDGTKIMSTMSKNVSVYKTNNRVAIYKND